MENHHQGDRPNYCYLFPELLADVGSGHNIRVTCYEQVREMDRVSGPDELRSLDETEVVSVAAMSEAGKYRPTRALPASSALPIYSSARAPRILKRHLAVSAGVSVNEFRVMR